MWKVAQYWPWTGYISGIIIEQQGWPWVIWIGFTNAEPETRNFVQAPC